MFFAKENKKRMKKVAQETAYIATLKKTSLTYTVTDLDPSMLLWRALLSSRFRIRSLHLQTARSRDQLHPEQLNLVENPGPGRGSKHRHTGVR
jgi:hypothetical protein